MSKHIGLTLRIGARHDDLTVNSGGNEKVFNRQGMSGFEKKALLKDVQKVRGFNAALAVAG